MRPDVLRRLTMVLGCLSVAAICVAHLALTDIRHGEADLTSEWLAVQIAFGVIVAFHTVALASLARRR